MNSLDIVIENPDLVFSRKVPGLIVKASQQSVSLYSLVSYNTVRMHRDVTGSEELTVSLLSPGRHFKLSITQFHEFFTVIFAVVPKQ